MTQTPDIAALVRSDVAELDQLLPGAATRSIEPAIAVVRPSREPVARSAYDVDRLLAGTASFAADALSALPGSLATQRTIDLPHLLAWCTSTFRVDDVDVPQWADLSGVYGTADGRHLQLHCNFAHHAEGVVRHLGVAPERAALAAAISEREGELLEAELIDQGMIAALIRTPAEWDAHPHAIATRDLPLITVEQIGDAPPGDPRGARSDGVADTRVLDCTRVLAGPVAGHLLAAAGCDVMRLGAAHLPAVDVGVLSTGFGKRNAFADLRTATGREATEQLLAGSDVWLDAFRPGSFAARGIDPQRAATLRPGIVVVQVSAFDAPADTSGPWAGRRGYDSIVQSTTGLRWEGGQRALDAEGSAIEHTPRGLPVQALDHATGFLAAGVAARLLAHQRTAGGSWCARLSLLRTRNRLVELAPAAPYAPRPPAIRPEWLDTISAPVGSVTAVRPFIGRWTGPPQPLGSSDPAW